MKSYISIPHIIGSSKKKSDLFRTLHVAAFDKLDGSNIRAEFNPKRGFYKFGSRKVLIDENSEHLGKAVTLIQDTKAKELAQIFKDLRWDKPVVCFFEYHGERSFAGNHHPEDDHQVTLIDVSPHKQGLIAPKEFIKHFSQIGIPNIIHQGLIDDNFVEAVKQSKLDGITLEGIVCKAANPNGKKTSQPIMFKIKTEKWLDMLREFVDYDEKLFRKLM